MRTRLLALATLVPAVAVAQPATTRPVPPPAPCALRTELVTSVRRDRVVMKVVLRNLAARATTLALGSLCGARYTIDGEPRVTCPPSPCRTYPAKQVTVPAKGTLVLGTTTVRATETCREPLPSGSTFFQAQVIAEPDQPRVCAGDPVHVIKDARTGRLRKAERDEPAVDPTPVTPPPPAP